MANPKNPGPKGSKPKGSNPGRPSGRAPDELRKLRLETGVSVHAEGSCLVELGRTRVLCTASVEERVPPFLRNSGRGWITAEYGMLPRATHSRMMREAARGKQSGRTMEIQRLIGRALRSVADLAALGERQIRLDCDVLQADGGTRTAAVTGGYVALHLACEGLLRDGRIERLPLASEVAAVSCGLLGATPLLDLDYEEDSQAAVDANFVLTGDGRIVEIQSTGEENPFSRRQFLALLGLAGAGVRRIVEAQRRVLPGRRG
jgi:ribonuclease PH